MNFWDWASTMSIDEVLKVVLAFAKVLAWPLVVIVIAIMFRKELTALLQRLESLDGLGIKSRFRRAVKDTINEAEQAEADAAKLAAAGEDDSRVPDLVGRDGPAGGEVPASSAQAGAEKYQADRGPKKHQVDLGPKKHQVDLGVNPAPESSVWAAFRRGLMHAQNDPQRLLTVAWNRLEEETERVTKTLKTESTTKVHADRDPVALFQRLYTMNLVTTETVRGVERAAALRDTFQSGWKNEAYDDQVIGLAAAVDGFTRSLSTIRLQLLGKRTVDDILRQIGDQELPHS